MNILGFGWPRLHAALNHLPVALLLVTVLFDTGAWITKRESLRAAALWTLWAGVIGWWAAVVAGLQAEEVIDHGNAIHDIMEPHETLALIVTMGVFTVVAGLQAFPARAPVPYGRAALPSPLVGWAHHAHLDGDARRQDGLRARGRSPHRSVGA